MIGILLRVVVGLISTVGTLGVLSGLGYVVLRKFPGNEALDRRAVADCFILGLMLSAAISSVCIISFAVGSGVLHAVTG